ncbi:MAG: TrmJ/YjtD family RNA methyltransferase [Candidatus Aenigmatarchaeota archaeon]|nr:MAG: TrmJ/YjtD family RNA methyltransferase [Candidatus Aenigmarchaeota archaeon]
MIDVVLIQPEQPGNIGAVARAMKNFGFQALVLVDPCELTDETRAQAKHAYDVIKNARILRKFEPKKYDYVIGTTGIMGEGRPCVTPEELKALVPGGKVALVFGNEGRGLSRHDMEACDVLVHIPTSDAYAVMNLSHAAAIVLYELSGAHGKEVSGRKERRELEKAFINILDNLGYRKKEDAARAFGRLVNRAPPRQDEASTLVGVLKRIEKTLNGERL